MNIRCLAATASSLPGGIARAKALSAEKRAEIAKPARAARSTRGRLGRPHPAGLLANGGHRNQLRGEPSSVTKLRQFVI